MTTSDFAPLILLLALAPPDWVAMRATYRYDDPLSDVRTYAIMASSNDEWVRVSHTEFKMMDFFDTYREKTHPKMEKPWTTMTVTIKRDDDVPVVEFGYETPDIIGDR
jgi:hypothetical protein